MADATSAHLRRLQLAHIARQNVLDLLRQRGPMTMDAIFGAVGFRYSGTVDTVADLRERGEVFVTGTIKSMARGRPVNVYGIVGLHKVQRPTIRDRILTLLRDDGPSPSLELARKIGIHPKTCRYHMLRLLSQRKVQAVGKLQRPSGGTPATVWSANV